MIELKGLRFSYSEASFEIAIDKLCVHAGERVCWIGPSGSGKTTLLNLAAGILTPEFGLVNSCGVELSALNESSRRDFRIANVGLVFQDFALLDYLSVLENILLPYRINSLLRLDESARSRASSLASEVGLGDMLSRRPNQLSQGERQRVAACRAIIAQPKLLLADEPTANLDANSAARVLNLLDQYATEKDATLIAVSHDPEVMKRFRKTMDVSEFCVGMQSGLTKGGSSDA